MDDLTKVEVPLHFDSDGIVDILLKKLNKIISPVGTHDNPALSCQDIFNCQGTSFVAGTYNNIINVYVNFYLYVGIIIPLITCVCPL